MDKTKDAPKCGSCDFCHQQNTPHGTKKLDFCHHPIWRITRALKKRWIPSKEKGSTSPAWCPLRVPAKEG